MQKITNRIAKWFALFAMVLTFATALALPANAEPVFPGDEFISPPCPQIEISSSPFCDYSDDFGVYGIIPTESPMPLSDRNFVPCSPEAIDSYFPPNAEPVIIFNQGDIPLDVQFVCD